MPKVSRGTLDYDSAFTYGYSSGSGHGYGYSYGFGKGYGCDPEFHLIFEVLNEAEGK